MKVIVLLSGGLDSTTCASIAVKEYGSENVIAVSLGYGQKHRIELEHAKAVVKELKISKHIIKELPPIFEDENCTLTNNALLNPTKSYSELRKEGEIIPTNVPFRNANFLAVATTIAMIEDAGIIYYGAHADDAQNWVYADCTFEFNGAMANAIFVGTYKKVRLIVPLQFMTKTEVVKKGLEVNAPFHLTRSCYNGGDVSCGICSTCRDRISAFKDAGATDPIHYEVKYVV